MLAVSLWQMLRHQVVHERVERKTRQSGCDHTGVELAHLQQVIEQARQVGAAGRNAVEQVKGIGRGLGLQHFNVQRQRRQRLTQVMAGSSQKARLGVVGTLGALLGGNQFAVHVLALGDVQRNATHQRHPALALDQEKVRLVHPDGAVGAQHFFFNRLVAALERAPVLERHSLHCERVEIGAMVKLMGVGTKNKLLRIGVDMQEFARQISHKSRCGQVVDELGKHGLVVHLRLACLHMAGNVGARDHKPRLIGTQGTSNQMKPVRSVGQVNGVFHDEAGLLALEHRLDALQRRGCLCLGHAGGVCPQRPEVVAANIRRQGVALVREHMVLHRLAPGLVHLHNHPGRIEHGNFGIDRIDDGAHRCFAAAQARFALAQGAEQMVEAGNKFSHLVVTGHGQWFQREIGNRTADQVAGGNGQGQQLTPHHQPGQGNCQQRHEQGGDDQPILRCRNRGKSGLQGLSCNQHPLGSGNGLGRRNHRDTRRVGTEAMALKSLQVAVQHGVDAGGGQCLEHPALVGGRNDDAVLGCHQDETAPCAEAVLCNLVHKTADAQVDDPCEGANHLTLVIANGYHHGKDRSLERLAKHRAAHSGLAQFQRSGKSTPVHVVNAKPFGRERRIGHDSGPCIGHENAAIEQAQQGPVPLQMRLQCG